MINTGSKENFTEEELRMFADIERITNGSARLKVKSMDILMPTRHDISDII